MVEEIEEATEEETEKEMLDSDSVYIRRPSVDNGIAQLVCCLLRCVDVLRRIWIPRSFEALSLQGSTIRRSLSSVIFESESRLTGIESNAFSSSSLQTIVIP
jgi:hypothetical protein